MNQSPLRAELRRLWREYRNEHRTDEHRDISFREWMKLHFGSEHRDEQ